VPGFETPTDLMNNRGLIADPETFARENGAASWPGSPTGSRALLMPAPARKAA
jgi:hypothetical protein